MKKILFLFLSFITPQCSLHSQQDPLQKYYGQGCPTLLMSCVTPPDGLANVGSFGLINNATGLTDFRILNTNRLVQQKKLENFYAKHRVLFSSLAQPDPKNNKMSIVTLEPVARETAAKAKIEIVLDNPSNSVIIRSYNTLGQIVPPSNQLDLDSLAPNNKTADFLSNFPGAGIMWPDTDTNDRLYFNNVISQRIKGNIKGICNLHIAHWTVDFTIDEGFLITINKLTLLYKYPVMVLPTAEDIREGKSFDPTKPCEIKSFNYTMERKQLLDEDILIPFNEETAQKTNGDTTQST